MTSLLGFLTLDPQALDHVRALTLGWDPLTALKKASPDIQQQVSKELKTGTIKPHQVPKRCNQLRFGAKGQAPSPKVNKRDLFKDQLEPGEYPLLEAWEGLEEKTPGWSWGVDYPLKCTWQFTVNLESLNPLDPQKYLGQWFLAMAGALGQTKPDAQVADQLKGLVNACQSSSAVQTQVASHTQSQDEEPLDPEIAAMVARQVALGRVR